MTAQPASSNMTQQISARNSATSGATTGSNRSNDRVPSEQNYVSNNQPLHYNSNQQMKQQPQIINSAAGSNYYYSSQADPNHLIQQQQLQQQYQSNQPSSTHHQHAPSNLSNKSSTNKGNTVIAQQQNNQMAAMQAYSQQTYPGTTNKQQRKTAYSNEHPSQFSPPSNSSSQSISGIISQIMMGASKKSIGNNNNAINQPPNQSNLNRYETLQSKLKNKRRGQPTANLVGSNSSQIIGPSIPNSSNKNLQANGDQKQQFNQTQKIVMQTFGQQPSTGQLSNRKQLKLSVDQHSDSSFNNISIKSADKHNSVVRQIAAGLLSHKNNTQTLNMKDLSHQISPSSHNGGSILQNFNSSQNSVYSSNFSNNSRFNNRPKNPTDTSSLSSKNSDNLSSHMTQQQVLLQNTTTKAVLADLKKNLLQKQQITNNGAPTQQPQNSKQSAIQMIKDQQQMLIKQHQQSDSLSDSNNNNNAGTNGAGSFSSGHSQTAANEAVLQKPLQTKLYSSINTKIQQSSQMKPSNSIANLSKINQQIHLSGQSNVPSTPGYKSKFTLMNRAVEKPHHIMESSNKNSNRGADSYRRQTEISKKKTSISKTTGNNCGAPFSPKQSNPNNVSSKIASLTKANGNNQIYLSNIPQGYRNNGGLIVKGSIGQTSGSIGSTHSKKSGRDLNNKTQEVVQKSNTLTQSSVQVKPQLIKPQYQQQQSLSNDLLQHQIQVTAQLVGIPQTKMNLEQIQSLLIKQQQNQQQQNAYKGDTIQEERFEDSEQNTKRESTAANNNNQKASNPNLIATSIQEVQIQQQLSNATSYSYLNGPQKSKSLLTINLEQSQSMKRIEVAPHPENIEQTKPPAIEEIKQNSTLQAMKEKLKTQISLQHHPFSNPNQPSSQIEVAEVAEPVYPLQPRKALQLYFNNLTDHEKTEILDFNEIYFLGLGAQKIQASSSLQHNCGYDDDRGDYQVVLQDHLCYRYQILDFLGKGSFGQALKCKDHKTNEEVAVKIIRNKKRFHHQAGVELNILNYLKEHDPDDVNNIIRIKDYSVFRKHLIISFELLSINLYEFIKNNNFNGVSLSLIRRFAIQILQALKYQREHGVIHCDLKPENILLKQPNKSGIKIIDYGSSCFQNQRIYTYIQSRFYRAPEIVMGIPYTTSIDMWSFGCILAELFKGYPLFPGENEMEQLAYIMEIKGVPEDYLLELSSRRKLFFDTDNQPIIVANSKGKKRRPLTKTLKGVLKCSDENFLDFLDQCLDWDPVNRMTPLEALQHQWILEGLPEKVLMHHQRMFGNRDDKTNIKEATLTPIQGFPPDAENNTIFTLLKTKRAEAIQQKQQQLQQQPLPLLPDDQNQSATNQIDHVLTQDQSMSGAPPVNVSTQLTSQQRKTQGNKTIQNLMQELFDEKAQEKSGKQQKSGGIQPQAFYTNSQQQQVVKNANINYMQIVEVVKTARSNHHQHNQYQGQIELNNEDDIEEGVNFNKTQKIPMSLIKQQEKIPISQQVPFYNPKVTGPKLNNYISQAAINKKRDNHHASSASNLNLTSQQTRVINQSMNNLQPQITGNSQTNQCRTLANRVESLIQDEF